MDKLSEMQPPADPPIEVAAGPPEATTKALQEDPTSLAREIGRAYGSALRYYATTMQEELSDADRKARGDDPELVNRVVDTPSEHLDWRALGMLLERDLEAATAVWHRVAFDAGDELASGHRASVALEWQGRPWDRARFMAIRQALVAEWQPRGRGELLLIDQMAIAHAQFLDWTERLYVQSATEARTLARDVKFNQRGSWDPPRIDAADAMDQAAAMAERWQKLYVRAARALRDLRRFAPSVIVNGAAQVNVAAVQQNVARGEG